MYKKYIKSEVLAWLAIEFICVIAFLLLKKGESDFSENAIAILGTFAISIFAVFIICIQIKQIWLNIGEVLAAIVTIFWITGSVIGIIMILYNVLFSEKYLVVLIPLMISVLFTGLFWKKYMKENDPKEITRVKKAKKVLRDKAKICI